MANNQPPYSYAQRDDGDVYRSNSSHAVIDDEIVDDITINDDPVVIADKPTRHAAKRRLSWPSVNGSRTAALVTIALVGLVAILAATIGAFLITGTSANEINRDVKLAGENIGGQTEDQLLATVTRLASSFGVGLITVTSPEGQFSATANEMGIGVDVPATVASLMDQHAPRGAFTRFGDWFGSFFGDTNASFVLNGDPLKVATIIETRDPGPKQPPADPGVEVVGSTLKLVPAGSGRGIDPRGLTDSLRNAASKGLPVTVQATRTDVVPRFSNDEAAKLIDTANTRVAKGITITAGQTKATINASSLREWTRLSPSQDSRTQVLTLDPVATQSAIETGLAGANTPPTDASLSVTGNGIVVSPGAAGRECCQDTAWATLSNAIFDPSIASAPANVVMATNEIAPTVTEAQLQALGITEAVSTFTTKHPAGQPRVKNIHKVADLMRGKIIMPGQSLSVNQIVGERTTAKGYVMAPSIAEGKFSESPGGGISQFATTLFNAAFFAGMDLEKYQAHSIYISRYPYGREATLSWPSPDLQIGNPSPYGVLIWPTYTESSITVTLYSTKWVTATQTGQTKGTSGSCTTVRTTRSRVKVDGSGSLPEDSVRAVYRAQEGLNCGDAIPTTTIAPPTTVAVTPTPTTAPATTPTTAAPATTVPVTP